jgi:hypothetical protein
MAVATVVFAPRGFPQEAQAPAPGSLYASQLRQTTPRMPVSLPISTSAPQAGQLLMVMSSFAPQTLHLSKAMPPPTSLPQVGRSLAEDGSPWPWRGEAGDATNDPRRLQRWTAKR